MTASDLKKVIDACLNDVTFIYNGKQCGITSEVTNYQPTFTEWYGNDFYETGDIDELMNNKLFDGYALSEICTDVEINIL